MPGRRIVPLLVCSLTLASCNRRGPNATGTPAPAAARRPEVTVSGADGLEVTHVFHRGVELAPFLKTLPSGSVDHIGVNDSSPYLIAVVTAVAKGEAEGAPMKRPPRAFRTTFRGKDGQQLIKKWGPAAGNKSGKWAAVFVLPDSFDKAETTLLDEP
jgi:hypothetical protein